MIQETHEEQLTQIVKQMEGALSQEGHPDFKTFWESQKRCLELLKENISPHVKAAYWEKYRDLTREVKRLREIFQEQSAFASEQIDGAVSALEQDIQLFENRIENALSVNLPGIPGVRMKFYQQKQKEAIFLNALAGRVNSLRKELIKTEMRVRQKNQFFERLSSAGDFIFPKRKELIKEISEAFLADVALFLKTNNLKESHSLFQLREEIKNFQQMAKILSLNTQAFTDARLKLSEFWEKIKDAEKERKKELDEQKHQSVENAREVSAKIAEIVLSMKDKQPSAHEIERKQAEILNFMHAKTLAREDVKKLREELDGAFKPFRDKLLEEEKKRREVELEEEEARQAKIKALEEHCFELEEQLKTLDESALSSQLQELEREITELRLSEKERELLFRLLRPARDHLEKISLEKAFALPGTHPQKGALLEELFREATQKRIELKAQLEKYRKASGASGLDFEQSLFLNEQIHQEKERLEHLNMTITRLEAEIASCKSTLL